jgi:3-oxoadipate enol-lactonase
MPHADVNGISIHYRLDGEGEETLVLINGLADDLETWAFQMDDFLAAGLRVLRFDNRGVGHTDMPSGPYTTRLLADDTKALVDWLGITDFHLLGVSMGGMISQEYALAYGQSLRSLVLACTYAQPGPFCGRMFSLWADLAPRLGVPFVMRDVTLWAFTNELFEEREGELAEFEAGMADLPQPVDAYLAQLASIRTHDTTGRLDGIATPTLVLAGESDILIPVALSRSLQQQIPASEWKTVKGGHACLWEHPQPFNATVIDFVARHARTGSPSAPVSER